MPVFDVAVMGDTSFRINEVTRAVGPVASLKLLNISSPPRELAFRTRLDVVNIDTRSPQSIGHYRRIVDALPQGQKARIFAVDPHNHRDVTQVYALGATEIVNTPIQGDQLTSRIARNLASHSVAPPLSAHPDEVVAYTGAVLREMMVSVRFDQNVPLKTFHKVGDALVESISGASLSDWIATVRRFHAQTFEHCLTVTAVAVGFGLSIGLSRADLNRIALCGMAHDVGKSFIPVEILEKPGKLSDQERLIIETHPMLGHRALQKSGAEGDVLDATLHHHEYLDGSGYPNGLIAGQVSDMARIITIADIFGALIERRAYKAPIPPLKAYEILEAMGPRLDQPLVKAFRRIATTVQLGD